MKHRARWMWMALIVLPLILSACAKSPDEVARAFYEAFERHDFLKARGNVCPSLYDEMDAWIKAEGDRRIQVDLDVSYQQVEKDGDRVVIQVSGTKRVDGQTYVVDYRMRLEKKDGWKVCDMR